MCLLPPPVHPPPNLVVDLPFGRLLLEQLRSHERGEVVAARDPNDAVLALWYDEINRRVKSGADGPGCRHLRHFSGAVKHVRPVPAEQDLLRQDREEGRSVTLRYGDEVTRSNLNHGSV